MQQHRLLLDGEFGMRVCVCAERTIKVDKVEAAAVQRYSAEAKEQSRRLQEANARANGAAAVDDTAEAVQEGVDQAADAAQEVTGQVADGELQHLAAYSVKIESQLQARHCWASRVSYMYANTQCKELHYNIH